jgi:hypothetical protein
MSRTERKIEFWCSDGFMSADPNRLLTAMYLQKKQYDAELARQGRYTIRSSVKPSTYTIELKQKRDVLKKFLADICRYTGTYSS